MTRAVRVSETTCRPSPHRTPFHDGETPHWACHHSHRCSQKGDYPREEEKLGGYDGAAGCLSRHFHVRLRASGSLRYYSHDDDDEKDVVHAYDGKDHDDLCHADVDDYEDDDDGSVTNGGVCGGLTRARHARATSRAHDVSRTFPPPPPFVAPAVAPNYKDLAIPLVHVTHLAKPMRALPRLPSCPLQRALCIARRLRQSELHRHASSQLHTAPARPYIPGTISAQAHRKPV